MHIHDNIHTDITISAMQNVINQQKRQLLRQNKEIELYNEYIKKLEDSLNSMVDMSKRWGKEWFDKETWSKVEEAKNLLSQSDRDAWKDVDVILKAVDEYIAEQRFIVELSEKCLSDKDGICDLPVNSCSQCTGGKQNIDEAAENYILSKSEYNKWLRELTDDEAIYLKNMLIGFSDSIIKKTL